MTIQRSESNQFVGVENADVRRRRIGNSDCDRHGSGTVAGRSGSRSVRAPPGPIHAATQLTVLPGLPETSDRHDPESLTRPGSLASG